MNKEFFQKLVKRLCLFLLSVSALYYTLRVVMIVLTQAFGFYLFSHSLNINLSVFAWTTDIFMGLISHFFAFFYFKKKLFSFLLFLLAMVSIVIWFPMVAISNNLYPVVDPALKNNYAYSQFSSTRTAKLGYSTYTVTLYEKVYPLLYKEQASKKELFSKEYDPETVKAFDEHKYVVSDDRKTLCFGKLIVPLK